MTAAETHILVADDQRNVRDTLKMILETAGYHVDATGDSQEVLARIHRRSYDIAFIDLNMSKMNSLDLIRFIRALSKKTTALMNERRIRRTDLLKFSAASCGKLGPQSPD
jgi:two-component system C4-dicarboxylate transport response regulator DctD